MCTASFSAACRQQRQSDAISEQNRSGISQGLSCSIYCCLQVRSHLPPGVDGWGYSLKGLMGLVVIGGLLITFTYFMLQRAVVPKYASRPLLKV